MKKITIQVRTRDNLLELLKTGSSAAWIVARDKEQQITHVEIVNFDGTQRIEGIFDPANSVRQSDNRLIIAFTEACIKNCNVTFDGQNPVRYF